MIPKSAITFQVTDHPSDPNILVGSAENKIKVDWVVGKVGWGPNDFEHLKLSTVRKVWTVLYGDLRTELINIMNILRTVPSPDHSVIDAIDKIESMLLKLNFPHSEDLE